MANPFTHIELNTTDPDRARTFYAAIFDWKFTDVPMPGGTYTMIGVGTGTGGGMMQHPMPGAPSLWIPYVQVDDIHASTNKARGHGATIIREVTEVMGSGWLSILIDPTGAALGLWQPKAA